MFTVIGNEIQMTEADYGIKLPVTISGTTLTASDEILFTIKKQRKGDTVLTKTYTNITQNTFDIEITEAESALLHVGNYVYSLDWYQSGAFMCNIIPLAAFKVGEKA